jgi:hypothetical protein
MYTENSLMHWWRNGAAEMISYTVTVKVIRMIKSRRMRWAGHVARMGEKRNAYRILV